MKINLTLLGLISLIFLFGCENADQVRKNPLKKYQNQSCKSSNKSAICMAEIEFKEVSQAELTETILGSAQLFNLKPGDQFIEKTTRAFRQSMDCEAQFIVRKTFVKAVIPYLYTLVEFMDESRYFEGDQCREMNPNLPKRFIMKSNISPEIADQWKNIKNPRFFVAQDQSGYFKISGEIKTTIRDLHGNILVLGNLNRSYLNLIERASSEAYFRNNLMNIYQLRTKNIINVDLSSLDLEGLKTLDAQDVQY